MTENREEREEYQLPQNETGEPPQKKSKAALITLIICLTVVVIALAGVAAYAFVLTKIDDVSGLTVTDVTQSGLTLNWDSTPRADGYIVYQMNDKRVFEKIADVNGKNSYTVTKLDQAKEYAFSVSAYNRFAHSERQTAFPISCTLPSPPKITKMTSPKKGTVHVEWSQNDRADGYILEFKTVGYDYREDSKVIIERTDECYNDITELLPKTELCVRVSSFVNSNGRLTGKPSEEKTVEVTDEEPEEKSNEKTLSEGVDPDKPMVALTFDDGPLNGSSGERILDVLEKYKAKATFFMIGSGALDHSDNIKRKKKLGMELGNHTWDHTHYGDKVTAEDISKASEAIRKVAGEAPTAFRSPGGLSTDGILSECAAEGMAVYHWSIDTEDWKTRDADKVYHAAVDKVKDGDIILMHEIYDSTADAVAKIVPALIDKGYQLVTCSDLVQAKSGNPPEAGKQYSRM